MPKIAISVDCEAASAGKCYTKELVKLAEEFNAPLTWLLYVSGKDPMSNVDLYHSEYYHRIPAWHEIGLLLGFENSLGYLAEPQGRADLIRLGKDVLKSRHIKPTSFRAARFDLLKNDLRALEDIGIMLDASACPGGMDKHEVAWPNGETQPYHPSYSEITKPGEAKIVMAPLATYNGICAYLDKGWDKVGVVVEKSIEENDVTVVACSDYANCVDALAKTLALGKDKKASFVTLTQLAL